MIHFDAYFDAGDPISVHMISHAQPIRRLVDDGHVLGKNYIQVGLRGYWPGEKGFKWMRENGLRYHTMAEIKKDDGVTVMERVLEEANDGPEHLYISFDIDVLDPAYTRGTGTPEPGGLTRDLSSPTRAVRREQSGRFRPRGAEPSRRPGLHDGAQLRPARARVPDGDRHEQEGAQRSGLFDSADLGRQSMKT